MRDLSDYELASKLVLAERSGDTETAIFATNEICDRLDLSLDETEQGLTPAAAPGGRRLGRQGHGRERKERPMTTLLTREQAARVANECDEREAAEALITGEGGDLTVALLDDEGANVATFVLNPDGEIAEVDHVVER